MFNRLAAFFAMVLFAFVAQAQDLKGVSQQYKPGDRVRYRVAFDGDPKFDSVSLGLYLDGSPRPNQPGLNGYFALSHMMKVGPGVYDVDGTIPANAPDGTYEVHWVNAGIGPASKQYDTTDRKITIRVDNDAKYEFPPLKSIAPE